MNYDQPGNTTETNIERLRGHLEDGTLAAELVDTYRASPPEERAAALKAIAASRLAEIRAGLARENLANGPD